MSGDLVLYALSAAIALVAGVGIGIRVSRGTRRIRELESRLEQLGKESELARSEADSARDELRRTREAQERYRGQVADHFSGISERMRGLTLQYRAVYDHLTEGARTLCPEGFRELESGLRAAALPPESKTPGPQTPAGGARDPEDEGAGASDAARSSAMGGGEVARSGEASAEDEPGALRAVGGDPAEAPGDRADTQKDQH